MDGFKVPALPPAGAVKRKYPTALVEEESRDSGGSKRPRHTSSDPLANPTNIAAPRSERHSGGSKAPLPPSIPVGGFAAAGPLEPEEDLLPAVDDEILNGVGDETYEADDGDEEGGRFFGGGTNATQDQILDILAGADDEDLSQATLTLAQLKKQTTKFERVVQRNYEQRAKFSEDPTKYIDSESDLDLSLAFFLPLTQNPLLYYPTLLASETLIPTLVNLLTHENTDIACTAVEVLAEMTDEDVGEDEAVDEDEDNTEKAKEVRMVMGDFINALLANDIITLLVANLRRLNEEEESDQNGVHKILTIIENLLSFLPPLALQIVQTTDMLMWLLTRINPAEWDSNAGYAAEILAIMLQEEREVRLKLTEDEGLDGLIHALSQYRIKDPGSGEELESMENLFNALCSALNEPEIKWLFHESEGVELMVIMMKEKLLSKTRAIKVLDYALQTQTAEAKQNCMKFIEVLGLKTLFAAFMGKGHSKKKAKATALTFEDDEHILGILSSLFTNLDADSVPRLRLLAKFVEGDYEKFERLLELRDVTEGKLRAAEREIEDEKQMMTINEEEITDLNLDGFYLQRMNAGLSFLQHIDYCLAWLVVEDDGARAHAQMLLGRKNKTLQDTAAVLREFWEVVQTEEDEDPAGLLVAGTNDEPVSQGETMTQANILQALFQAIQHL